MTSTEPSAIGRVDAGPAARRVARLAGYLVVDERDDRPLTLAIRLAIDQLFRRASPSRRAHLVLAADALASLRAPHLRADDGTVLDLLMAACLVRAGEGERARHLVEMHRQRMLGAELRAALRDIDAELVSASDRASLDAAE